MTYILLNVQRGDNRITSCDSVWLYAWVGNFGKFNFLDLEIRASAVKFSFDSNRPHNLVLAHQFIQAGVNAFFGVFAKTDKTNSNHDCILHPFACFVKGQFVKGKSPAGIFGGKKSSGNFWREIAKGKIRPWAKQIG
jgi:hypothetical protein